MKEPTRYQLPVVHDENELMSSLEEIAEYNGWTYVRTNESQVSVAIIGDWSEYQGIVTNHERSKQISVVFTIEHKQPKKRTAELYHLLNLINDNNPLGVFTYWVQKERIMWRQLLFFEDEADINVLTIDLLIENAVFALDRFMPAFKLIAHGKVGADDAFAAAVDHGVGRA